MIDDLGQEHVIAMKATMVMFQTVKAEAICPLVER
jgi:hypothetical protein